MKTWRALLSVLVFCGLATGLYAALHSDLSTVRVVEVVDLPESSPLDAQAILKLAQVPVGRVNLYELDLDAVEKRLLGNSWVRKVRLQRRFPQTLAVQVEFRTPKALLAQPSGKIAYVDSTGQVFGKLQSQWFADLPLLTAAKGSSVPVPVFLELLRLWNADSSLVSAQVSELRWDTERGVRAFVRYSGFHAWVDLGEQVDSADTEELLPRLAQVIEFLKSKSVAARQIYADSDSKIVVQVGETH